MRHWNINSSRRLILGSARLRRAGPGRPPGVARLIRESLAKHEARPATNVERQPQRRRNYWLGAFEVADGCAQLADEFRTSRPCDMIQYGIDLVGCVAKVLAP